MVAAVSSDVSKSIAKTMIAKRAASKGIVLNDHELQMLAEYSLSQSAAQATDQKDRPQLLPTSQSPLAKAMQSSNGPHNDNMEQALELAGGNSATLMKAVNALARRQLEEMFRYHGVYIIGGS